MRALVLTLALPAAAALAAETPAPSPSPTATPAGRPAAAARQKDAKAVVSPAPTASPSPGAKGAPKETRKPGHVFTNQDLPAEPAPVPAASPGTGRGSISEVGPHASEIPAIEATPPPPPEQTEAYWSERATQARQAVVSGEGRVAELEQRISELRDDRNPVNVMDPNREQNRRAQIAEVQAELEAARVTLDAARRALAELEDEARRKSIPPGWLRER
ncbi:MAG TPA: hypothetical protein VMR21_05235 [Vicinamibacteria bacterium]|nr:hypothetical protein [Vicinamibacteria bacterium]